MKIFRHTHHLKILVLTSVFFIFGCQSNLVEESAIEVAPEVNPVFEAVLTYEIEPTNDRKLEIVGKTNLPNGTKLNVRMRGKDVVYDALSEIKVRDGEFRSAEFSQDTRSLSAGDYWVTVTMVLSTMQSQQVRQVIGRNGENISGKIVRRYGNDAATIVVGTHFYLNEDGMVKIIPKTKPTDNENSNVNAVEEK